MTCRYAWDTRSLVKTFQGFVTGADFIESAVEVAADRRFSDLLMIYNDFSDITGHSIDAAAYARVAISRMGAMFTNANYRVSFVASDEHAPGLGQAIASSARQAPFDPVLHQSLAEARQWFTAQDELQTPRGQPAVMNRAAQH